MKINLKKKSTILIIFFVFMFIFLLIKNKNGEIVNFEPTPVPKVIYKNLELGISNRNDVVREIGAPQNEFQVNNSTVIEYTTRNPNFNDQYVIINNSLDFVKEIITTDNPVRITDLISKYGSNSTILYGPGSGISFYLFVYLDRGVAYIGHEKSGRIIEIWYFKPTSIDSFMNLYAKDYTKIKPINQ